MTRQKEIMVLMEDLDTLLESMRQLGERGELLSCREMSLAITKMEESRHRLEDMLQKKDW